MAPVLTNLAPKSFGLKMKKVVLFRKTGSLADDEKEISAIINAGFDLIVSRRDIEKGDLVIPRYSLLPFPEEFYADVMVAQATCINPSINNHIYVADLGNYIQDIAEFTPLTWDRIDLIPDNGPFILKGGTNSRKGQWKTMMYAENKSDAIEIYGRLSNDSLISQQKIYIRQFVKLKKYLDSVNGMPVTKEFRFFVCNSKVISGGFYWSNHIDDIKDLGFNDPSIDEVPKHFLQEVISRISSKINFVVVDVAQKEDGEWIVVELNDGCQSGLSCNDPDELYSNLMKAL